MHALVDACVPRPPVHTPGRLLCYRVRVCMQIQDELMTMLFAGSDTSANTLGEPRMDMRVL